MTPHGPSGPSFPPQGALRNTNPLPVPPVLSHPTTEFPISVRSLRVGRAGPPVFSQPIAGDGPRHPSPAEHSRPPRFPGAPQHRLAQLHWRGNGHFFPCGCRTPPSTGNLSGPAVPTYLHSAHTRSHTCTHTRTYSRVCPDTRHPIRAQTHPLTCAHVAREILAHVCGCTMRTHMTCACTRTAYSHTPVLAYASAHMFIHT